MLVRLGSKNYVVDEEVTSSSPDVSHAHFRVTTEDGGHFLGSVYLPVKFKEEKMRFSSWGETEVIEPEYVFTIDADMDELVKACQYDLHQSEEEWESLIPEPTYLQIRQWKKELRDKVKEALDNSIMKYQEFDIEENLLEVCFAIIKSASGRMFRIPYRRILIGDFYKDCYLIGG